MLMNVTVTEKLTAQFADTVQEVVEAHGELTVVVNREQIVEICRFLKDDADLRFDLLMDMAGVDYLGRDPRFEVVYHLYSVPHNSRLRLKVRVPEGDLVVPSVCAVWSTANWHEREAFDMLGIEFANHPDLRRIYMPDDYPGHPLRKDFPILGPDVEVAPRDDVHRLNQPPPPFISKIWRKGDVQGKSKDQG
jgi:NADH-quinone oxidoreductase subunit C